jgi:hypothetical protein
VDCGVLNHAANSFSGYWAEGFSGISCVTGSNTGGYSVQDVRVRTGPNLGSPATIKVGVYGSSGTPPDNGPSGNPLCTATAVTATADAENILSISGCPTLSAETRYYIVFITGNATFQVGDEQTTACSMQDGETTGRYTQSSYTISDPFPSPFGTVVQDGCRENLWLRLVAL